MPAIVVPKRKPNSILAHLLDDITPEEHRRRGELANELFRTITRRVQQTAVEKRSDMTKLDIIVPGPEMDSDPEAVALWERTGKFISSALAGMERGKAFSIMLGRLQHELKEAYGVENARKVMQAIMNTME